MSLDLTKLQRRLCNILQQGLPVCERPFEQIAKACESNEETILEETRKLIEAGVVRRIGAVINHRTLGMTSTLVAAHIEQKNLEETVNTINHMESVSHNYLRKHHYNLWFTLQASSDEEIKVLLANLSRRFEANFYSLPVERIFKLDVHFDTEQSEQPLLHDVGPAPKNEPVKLNKNQLKILSKLQNGLDVTANPFESLCADDLKLEDTLSITQLLIDKGVVRRIAAIVDHRKLGFSANVLFACKVPGKRIIQAGRNLARFRIVSHCFERATFEGWPYNLFAMMHSRSMGDIQHLIDKFVEAEKIDAFELLPTLTEFKKEPVRHNF